MTAFKPYIGRTYPTVKAGIQITDQATADIFNRFGNISGPYYPKIKNRRFLATVINSMDSDKVISKMKKRIIIEINKRFKWRSI